MFSIEVPDAGAADRHPFRPQEGPFEPFAAAVSPEPSARGDDPMTRDAWHAAALHDIADRPRRARHAGGRGHVAVGGYIPWRDPSHRRQDTDLEIWRFGDVEISLAPATAGALKRSR